MYLMNPKPEPENGDQRDSLVTPAMAKAGADELREHSFGESLQDIATAVFYAMQAAAADDAPTSEAARGG